MSITLNDKFLKLLENSKIYSKNNKTPKEIYNEYLLKQSQSDDNLAFDIDSFAKELGLTIDRGCLIVESGRIENKKIMLNSFDGELRQNFTVAHEIAHYLLHQCDEAKCRTEEDIYTIEQKKEEEEANFFARNLLMPEELLKKSLIN